MKYIIEDTQIYNVIYNFIENEFYNDNLRWGYDTDPESDQIERDILNFYGEKYEMGDQDEWTFQYVKKNYYVKQSDTYFANKWIEKAPLLDFLDKDMRDKFDNLFGNFWKPVFENWFKENYTDLPVKTFIY